MDATTTTSAAPHADTAEPLLLTRLVPPAAAAEQRSPPLAWRSDPNAEVADVVGQARERARLHLQAEARRRAALPARFAFD